MNIRARGARVTGMKCVRRQAMAMSFKKGAIPPNPRGNDRTVITGGVKLRPLITDSKNVRG